MMMELTVLIEALQREVEKRSVVDLAASELAHALGVEVEEHGLRAVERTLRELPTDQAARSPAHRLRSINNDWEPPGTAE
jgi:hypothetical protein